MTTVTRKSFDNWVCSDSQNAYELINWARKRGRTFYQIDSLRDELFYKPVDMDILPADIKNLIMEIQVEFPDVKFIVGYEPEKPPLIIPWKKIGKILGSISLVLLALSAGLLLLYLLSILLVMVLVVAALAMVDPQLTAICPTGEIVCCVTWYH